MNQALIIDYSYRYLHVPLEQTYVQACTPRRDLEAEIVETTLVVSRFCFLRVGSRISELRVIILRERKF